MKSQQDAELNTLLEHHFQAEEVQLIPSSGFLATVMSAVTLEAAAPERIRFPWGRALTGVLGVVAVLCGGGTYLAMHTVRGIVPLSPLSVTFAWTPAAVAMAGGGLAVLVSLGTMMAAVRVMKGGRTT